MVDVVLRLKGDFGDNFSPISQRNIIILLNLCETALVFHLKFLSLS